MTPINTHPSDFPTDLHYNTMSQLYGLNLSCSFVFCSVKIDIAVRFSPVILVNKFFFGVDQLVARPSRYQVKFLITPILIVCGFCYRDYIYADLLNRHRKLEQKMQQETAVQGLHHVSTPKDPITASLPSSFQQIPVSPAVSVAQPVTVVPSQHQQAPSNLSENAL